MKLKKIKYLKILCLLFISIAIYPYLDQVNNQFHASGAIFFVDPNKGNDRNAGTIIDPYKTLSYSVAKLTPGDVLFLRKGIYAEKKININISGTYNEWIKISNYPGEVPIIDGGYEEFRDCPNTDWEIHNTKKNIFKSKNKYPKAKAVHGYFKNNKKIIRLNTYDKYNNLAAENFDAMNIDNIYVGPGIFFNRIDKKIYVRLEYTRQQKMMGFTRPKELDPRNYTMYIFPHKEVLVFGKRSAYLLVEGLNVKYQNNAIEFITGAHHISIKNCEILGGRTHILIGEMVNNVLFDRIKIHDSVPPWIAYTDVKTKPRPAAMLKTAGFIFKNYVHDVEIKNSEINNTFDGIVATGKVHNIHIHNNTMVGIRDDVVQLGTSSYDIEISKNKMIYVSKGISRHGSGTPKKAGTKYIHHNIIDCSKPMLGAGNLSDHKFATKRYGPNGDRMVWARPFGSHKGGGYGTGDPWKIYNNTIIFGKELNGLGAGHCYIHKLFNPNQPQEVYNNIFIQTMDHWLARGARISNGSQIWDGNIYYRNQKYPTTYFFRSFKNGKRNANFISLAEFKKSDYFQDTKKKYSPGWENTGIEANPELDNEYYPSCSGPAATGAILLPSHWPGQDEGKYRGALSPKLANCK
jgi:hypothetical protein